MNSGPTCVALLVGVVAIYLSGLTVSKCLGTGWGHRCLRWVVLLGGGLLGPRHMMGEGLVDGDRPLLT